MTPEFGVFIQDGKDPLWRATFADRDEANRKAEELAKTEDVECFVYSFITLSEIARFGPPPPKRSTARKQHQASSDRRK